MTTYMMQGMLGIPDGWQITYADKEGFIGQKCAEMSTMAHKHMLQEQKLKTVNDQRLL